MMILGSVLLKKRRQRRYEWVGRGQAEVRQGPAILIDGHEGYDVMGDEKVVGINPNGQNPKW